MNPSEVIELTDANLISLILDELFYPTGKTSEIVIGRDTKGVQRLCYKGVWFATKMCVYRAIRHSSRCNAWLIHIQNPDKYRLLETIARSIDPHHWERIVIAVMQGKPEYLHMSPYQSLTEIGRRDGNPRYRFRDSEALKYLPYYASPVTGPYTRKVDRYLRQFGLVGSMGEFLRKYNIWNTTILSKFQNAVKERWFCTQNPTMAKARLSLTISVIESVLDEPRLPSQILSRPIEELAFRIGNAKHHELEAIISSFQACFVPHSRKVENLLGEVAQPIQLGRYTCVPIVSTDRLTRLQAELGPIKICIGPLKVHDERSLSCAIYRSGVLWRLVQLTPGDISVYTESNQCVRYEEVSKDLNYLCRRLEQRYRAYVAKMMTVKDRFDMRGGEVLRQLEKWYLSKPSTHQRS